MIGPVSVKVSSAHPDFPLRAVPVFQGSACSVGVECVPAYFGGVAVTGVSVSIETPDGETSTVAAKRSGCMWVATFGADVFGVPGSVRNGLTVTAHGLEEDGTTPAAWTLGKGDIDVISADGVPVPGEVWQTVHLRDSVPSTPVKGDLAKVGDEWRIYTGREWEGIAFGVKSVNGAAPDSSGDVRLVASDVGAVGNAGPQTIGRSAEGSGSLTLHGLNGSTVEIGTNDGDTAQAGYIAIDGKFVATLDNLIVAMDLVEVSGGYEIRLNGTKLSFAVIREAALTRNAVIRKGSEIYRAKYVSTNDVLWDCTRITNGVPQIGHIRVYKTGSITVTQPEALAFKSGVSDAKVTIVQGGVDKGAFTLNQSEDVSIEIDAGGGGGDGKHLVNVYAFCAKGHSDSNDQFVEVGGRVIRAYQAEWSVKVDDIPVISWDIDCMALVGAFRADSVDVSYNGYKGEGAGYMNVKANGEQLEEGVTQITEDTVLTIFFDNCLLSGTLILMADGSTKCIEDVHAGDVVASVNPVTGRLESDTVAASDAYCRKVVQRYDRWTFADGTVVETANRHRFWNVDLGEFMYLEAWKTGERALMHDGRTTALVSHEVVEEEATHHTLYTRKWNNYVANGLVSGNRKSKCLVRAES